MSSGTATASCGLELQVHAETGTGAMQTAEIHDYARQLLEAQGFKSIAEAAQKARAFEEQRDHEQAQTWRRIEAALMQMRGPHES
jgi:hypothetical protein